MYVERVPTAHRLPPPFSASSSGNTVQSKDAPSPISPRAPITSSMACKIVLKGGIALRSNDAFSIIHSYPHGHVATVLGSLKKLGLHTLISRSSSRPRDLVVAMIVASSTPAPNWPPRAPSPPESAGSHPPPSSAVGHRR